jgi:hypothetical protein
MKKLKMKKFLLLYNIFQKKLKILLIMKKVIYKKFRFTKSERPFFKFL